MKKLIPFLIVALLGVFLSACSTVSTANPPAPMPPGQFSSDIVGVLAQGAVPLVLEKNPSYAGTIEAVATALPVILDGVELTPQGIATALQALNERGALGLTPEALALLSSTLQVALLEYERAYGVPVVALNTDPGVKLVLNGFATGLKNGVAIWRAARAPPAP